MSIGNIKIATNLLT